MPDQDKTTSQPLSKVCLKCQKSYAPDLTACPDDGSKLETRENLIGLTLAKKYEIIGKLGEGGMAVVYKARHKVMQRDVAIKMLKKHLISDTVAYQRFEQESQAASSLNHPNIVTVFDFGNEDDHAYFVMDCVEGQTLSQRLEKVHWIAEEESLDIFAQLCEGLTHAHRKGVVHRDLKPSNVVLMPQDDGKVLVKIVDFGIAKLLPSAGKQIQKLTQAGEVFGSPLYMSPEQCLGKDLDPRSDIYSLGCLMYQALTGALPLMGDTAFETMNMHVSAVPPPFKQANPDVTISAETEAVVFKCLQKDPAHRYQSAAAILADLPMQGRVPLAITVRQEALSVPKRSAFDRNVIIFAVIFTAISGWIFFGWEGPVADRGTPYHKLFWNMCLSLGERLVENNQDRMAIWWFDRAKAHASQIGDQHTKYISTLSEEKSAYAGLGQQDMVDQIDDELQKIRRQSALEQKDYWMEVLKSAKQSTSTIDSRMKDALSKLGNVEQTALQLYGYGYYRQEQELLELALSDGVYRKGLAKNDKRLAELNVLLGKCYQAQSMMDQAANSYQDASNIYENIQHGSADAIKSLLILGIFQKERSDFEKARSFLGQAVIEARQFKAKATAAAQATASTTATERENEKAADNAELSSELAKQSTSAFVDLIKQLKLTKSPLVPEAEKFLKANSR